jgi:hypothetical protein
MQARTRPAGKIGASLDYNEEKVKRGEAKCIYAGNFLKNALALTYDDKRERFNNLLDRNQRADKKVMTIWLSFTPEEKFADQRLSAIASSYMQRIGYADQPYLVYRHDDTAIQHLHIVSTPVRPDGSLVRSFVRVSMVADARKAVEMEFGLQKSQRTSSSQVKWDRKIIYGKLPTLQVITGTLHYLLYAYNYRSMSELNAVLGIYNLRAITGRPNGRLNRHAGILYQITDEEGKGKGKPVKASAIPFKPTRKWLEKRFEQCKEIDPDVITGTYVGFSSILRSAPGSNGAFQEALRIKSLRVAPDRDPEGNVTGMLLVNIARHMVVNLTELRLGYDLADIWKKLPFDPLDRKIEPEAPKLEQKQQRKKGLRL